MYFLPLFRHEWDVVFRCVFFYVTTLWGMDGQAFAAIECIFADVGDTIGE